MVSRPLRGVGRIVQEDTVLVEGVAYKLVVTLEGDQPSRLDGRVDLDPRRVVQMIRSVAVHGSPLVLELEDGQRLTFAFRNTAGGIGSVDDHDS